MYITPCRTKTLLNVKRISASIILLVGVAMLATGARSESTVAVGMPTTASGKSPEALRIGQSIARESASLTVNTPSETRCDISGQPTNSLRGSTLLCLNSSEVSVPSVESAKSLAAEAANACVSQWTTTTKPDEFVACFARSVIPRLGSFLPAICSSARFSILPDGVYLCAVAVDANVPPDVMVAIAWQETRNNLRQTIRGSAGEIGRMQVSLRIQWRHPACAVALLKNYASNLRCGAAILRARFDEVGSWSEALRRYNGSGMQSRKYQREILAYIGWMRLREEAP